MKGRKYIVFGDGIGLKLIMVSKNIYILTIYQSHSLIPSSSPFFLPSVAISIYSAYLLACQTRDQSAAAGRQNVNIEIRLLFRDLYITSYDNLYARLFLKI